MIFNDRIDAGKQLAKRLLHYKDNAVVVAIPRGGIVTGKQIADELNAELDIVIPRKIGAPGNPELAIGAIAGKEGVLLNMEIINELRVSDEYIKKVILEERKEIERRESSYRQGKRKIRLEGKNCILVDDGLATGFTARAAIAELKTNKPSRIILAIPVAPKQTIKDLEKEVDEIACVHVPDFFFAISQFYYNFEQVSDHEVVSILGSSGN